ncbi:MAG: hypothetical protein A2133_07345 [Actinobacteria bacterium RBG_16_64_13]|nr:MAG: hypothetical protein A2133_07345 [Actinobacteria bacterium RBG_16_64_13]
MRKKSSLAFGVVGIVLIVVAIVWWVALAPWLVKLPSDLDVNMDFEGTLTKYLDPATGQPLPGGQGTAIPFTVLRTFASVSNKYTSSVAVCSDTIAMTAGGQESPAQITQYALDRKSRKCVESDENWAYSPQIVMGDRVGHYGPLFPGSLEVGTTVSAFFNDVNTAFDIKVAEKIDDYNGLGITAIKIDATRPATEYYPPIAQAVLGSQGLPMEITFAQLSAQLKAKGLDLDGLMGALATVATPEDMQALQALTQQPIKMAYKQSSGDVIYIEEKTGATVGADFDRTTTMEADTAGLLGAFAIIGKYASHPNVGPAIGAAMQAATQLAQAEPTMVFNQRMSIIPASEQTLAKDAQKKASLLTLVDLWIPLIIVIVGLLLLALGGYLLLRKRTVAASAS